MASEGYKPLGCRIEERPDGYYVVCGERSVGPFGHYLIPEAGMERAADELGVPVEEVEGAVLNHKPPEGPEPIDVRLSELRAELHGGPVKVRARVAGMSNPKAIPELLRLALPGGPRAPPSRGCWGRRERPRGL